MYIFTIKIPLPLLRALPLSHSFYTSVFTFFFVIDNFDGPYNAKPIITLSI